MKLKKLLPITILASFLLAACTNNAGGGGNKPIVLPEEHADGVHTFTINNLTELQAGWPAAGNEGGTSRTFDISVFTNGTEGNANKEMQDKNLELISNNPKVLAVSGFNATAGVMGEATIAVRYYETVQHFKFTISDTLPEPQKITNMSITQILADCPDHDMSQIYRATGVIKGWHSKDAWNKYGEFDLADPEDPTKFLYFYGSWVNTTAQPASFDWDGSAGKYTQKYTERNVLTENLTKDLKIGDTVVIDVLYAAQYSNFYGIHVSNTPAAVVEATSVTVAPKTLTLTVGQSEELTATVLPENCNQTASWSSDTESVATVDNGRVVAKGAGDAVITVTVGSQTDTCAVHVDADTSKDIVLTVDALGSTSSSYSDSTAAVDVKGVSWNYIELGNYGNGLQWRTKNSKSTTIWNSTAMSAVKSVTFKPNSKQSIFDAGKFTDAITVEFANNADFTDAQTLKVSFVTDGESVKLTPNAGMTYVRMTHADKGASLYLDSITFEL